MTTTPDHGPRSAEELIARLRVKRLRELLGRLEWDHAYAYKKERSRSTDPA